MANSRAGKKVGQRERHDIVMFLVLSLKRLGHGIGFEQVSVVSNECE